MEFISLGELTKAKIRHDNSGVKSSWFLDRIEVRDERVGLPIHSPKCLL